MGRRLVPWLALICVIGGAACHRMLPFEARGREASPTVELGGRLELGQGEAGADLPRSPCAVPRFKNLLAEYSFDDSSKPMRDTSPFANDGPWPPTGATKPTLVPGHAGLALHFDGRTQGTICGWHPGAVSWAEFPHKPHLDHQDALISLWVKFDSDPQTLEAIIAHDEFDVNPGNLSLMRTPNGALAVRLQQGLETVDSWRCSEAGQTPVRKWMHVEILVGNDLTVCVDGKLANHNGPIKGIPSGSSFLCTVAPFPGGLAGTTTAWVMGATNWCFDPSSTTPSWPMTGAIDEFQILTD